MTEGLAFEPPDDEPPVAPYRHGWLVLDPDGHVVAYGPQTVTDAAAGAGEEQ